MKVRSNDEIRKMVAIRIGKDCLRCGKYMPLRLSLDCHHLSVEQYYRSTMSIIQMLPVTSKIM